MTQAERTTRPALVWALGLMMIAIAGGCAENGAGAPKSDDNFEIRAMIASDREAIHAMDERMRRIEDQLQEIAHGSGGTQTSSPESAPPKPVPSAPEAVAPVAPPAAPSATPPGASAPSGPLPLGAPPAPGASAAPPDSAASAGSAPPRIEASAAPPPGGPAPPAAASPDETVIASTRNPAPGAPGEEGGAEAAAPSPSGGDDENTPPSAAPEASAPGDETANEGTNTETAPPEGPPAPAENPAAAPAAPSIAHGGEEVASAPPAAVPENAPAAAAAPRWPQDLEQELNSPSTAKGAAGKLFRSGLDAMKQRDYSAAVARFGLVQKKYPHSDLTEPAAYFSANALNEMGQYDQAILQYNDLVMRYPKGKYSTEALLREGQAFMQINDKIDARLTLQKLISDHAGTPEAAQASSMLKSLESN